MGSQVETIPTELTRTFRKTLLAFFFDWCFIVFKRSIMKSQVIVALLGYVLVVGLFIESADCGAIPHDGALRKLLRQQDSPKYVPKYLPKYINEQCRKRGESCSKWQDCCDGLACYTQSQKCYDLVRKGGK